jgi:Carbohydrate binding domain.
MNYCIMNADGIIENIIVCESDEVSAQFGAVASYDGAAIGEAYSPPPPPPTTEERVAALENENAMLKAQVSAQSAVTSITFVALAESGGLDEITASEHAELFAEWAYPVAYTVGQLRRYNGTLYKCVQAHTSQADWTPDTAASLWSVAADPAEEWPAWSQPVGAHDAYAKGDKVSHNGKHWTSNVDSNVWEPGVYGWTEATE